MTDPIARMAAREIEERHHEYPKAARAMLAALRACVELIRSEYSDDESAALDGHPVARRARKAWDMGCDAIAAAEAAGIGEK